jgi:tRNA(Ile)-lysidine synthase
VSLTADVLSAAICGHFLSNPPKIIGVAVSGGSDSLAVLLVLADWAAARGVGLRAVTVDHGLRDGSAGEAAWVGEICDGLGVAHDVLRWQGWDGSGNKADAARRARYDLIADWALQHGITQVALGHTMDDSAENLVMRLAREAGVDGLAEMAVRRKMGAVTLVRPALRIGREDLRDELRRRGQEWIDDPSNDDAASERVRVRQALAVLAPLGVSAESLAQVAQNMGAAREALNWYAFLAAREVARIDSGDVVILRKGWRALQPEIARRVLAQALVWVSRAEYPPRRRALALAIEAIRQGEGITLHGCQIVTGKGDIRVFRELSAVAALRSGPEVAWDGRWQMRGPWAEGVTVAALGKDALSDIPNWRETGRPAAALAASPAIWRDDFLVAAPLAGLSNGWQAELPGGGEDFFAAFLAT